MAGLQASGWTCWNSWHDQQNSRRRVSEIKDKATSVPTDRSHSLFFVVRLWLMGERSWVPLATLIIFLSSRFVYNVSENCEKCPSQFSQSTIWCLLIPHFNRPKDQNTKDIQFILHKTEKSMKITTFEKLKQLKINESTNHFSSILFYALIFYFN